MTLLGFEEFLAGLAELYAAAPGSVYVTFKHYDPTGDAPSCLVRAACNRKKISTLVGAPCVCRVARSSPRTVGVFVCMKLLYRIWGV